jgi:hypothetical protein
LTFQDISFIGSPCWEFYSIIIPYCGCANNQGGRLLQVHLPTQNEENISSSSFSSTLSPVCARSQSLPQVHGDQVKLRASRREAAAAQAYQAACFAAPCAADGSAAPRSALQILARGIQNLMNTREFFREIESTGA